MTVGTVLLLLSALVKVAIAQQIDTGPVPDNPEIRGGLLYDKWWAHLEVDVPEGDHPLWSTQTTNTRSGADTWRCKECHGWDYLGAEGAYGSGSHLTGFVGVYNARTKSVEDIVAILKGSANPDHDFSLYMTDKSLADLAQFIRGVRDYRAHVIYNTKAPNNGNSANGQVLFELEIGCQRCHGLDGAKINFGSAEEPELLGTIAVDNPQEFLHKVLYGQPGSDPRMTGAIELGWSMNDLVDIMAYAQSLPTGIENQVAAATPPAALPQSGAAPVDLSAFLLVGGLIFMGAGLLTLKRR
jgi:thiosulfate dehydrogenase